MPDLPSGSDAAPNSPPTDELGSAEATLAVLQKVVHPITKEDWSRQTSCREFTVAQLTDHVLNSITQIGHAAGAEIAERDEADSVERQIMRAARPALEAWRRRGLEGTVPSGANGTPAQVLAGVLSIEFLVHAWDYAMATGQEVDAPEPLSDYVLGLATKIITPQGRNTVGFDDAIPMPDGARVLDRLVAFTGRKPAEPRDDAQSETRSR
jgi:uncharacterized protein (TIGR03086 family)